MDLLTPSSPEVLHPCLDRKIPRYLREGCQGSRQTSDASNPKDSRNEVSKNYDVLEINIFVSVVSE